jgi:hypothetical protein
MTTIAARLDGFGRLGWIAVVIAGFMLWWPIGLIVLGYLIGSGRMGCFMMQSAERMQEQMEWMQRRMQEKMDRFCGSRGRTTGTAGRSGNRAFDEYRSETLRRLEDEEREFRDFLDRLRHAKDKGEFDQFMAERRRRDETPPAPQTPV